MYHQYLYHCKVTSDDSAGLRLQSAGCTGRRAPGIPMTCSPLASPRCRPQPPHNRLRAGREARKGGGAGPVRTSGRGPWPASLGPGRMLPCLRCRPQPGMRSGRGEGGRWGDQTRAHGPGMRSGEARAARRGANTQLDFEALLLARANYNSCVMQMGLKSVASPKSDSKEPGRHGGPLRDFTTFTIRLGHENGG